MNGTQIKAAVFELTGDRAWASDSTSADSLVMDWMRLCVEEFPPDAVEANAYTIPEVVAGEHYELPTDFASVAYYEIYDGETMVRREANDLEFTADTQVIFPIDNSLVGLYYYPIPVFEHITDTIPLNPIFHSCIIYFFYGQYYYQSGEGDYEEHKMADNYMGRFERMKNDKINLFTNKTPMSDPVKTVDALPKRSSSHRIRSDFYE